MSNIQEKPRKAKKLGGRAADSYRSARRNAARATLKAIPAGPTKDWRGIWGRLFRNGGGR